MLYNCVKTPVFIGSLSIIDYLCKQVEKMLYLNVVTPKCCRKML